MENSVQAGPGGSSQIAAINTKTFKIAWRVTTGSQSEGFALDTSRGMAYVANYDDDTLTTSQCRNENVAGPKRRSASTVNRLGGWWLR